MRLAADQGLAGAQGTLGNLYRNGLGVPQGYVVAHMWFSLVGAQSSGFSREACVDARDEVAARMTSEQIAEAQRLAREWKPSTEP